MSDFAARLVVWQKTHGRHDLPWQQTRDPYAVWLSEIMLQQTRVESVIPYYRRFLERFPDISALAFAAEEDVLACWSGLGYYARARNLHRAAKIILSQHDGKFPDNFDSAVALPGIARSTAAAILVFSFGQRHAILDGNVRRILARCFGIAGTPGTRATEDRLWQKAGALLPDAEIEIYTQALMDLGATGCTRTAPFCTRCPLETSCFAHREGRTGKFPTPKASSPLPHREVSMLIRLCGWKIFMEKRPSTGLWGGLWSFPEWPVEEPLPAHFDLAGTPEERLPEIRHAFTHFRLSITPRIFRVPESSANLPPPPNGDWFTPEKALLAAIPVPVRKILHSLLG